MQTVTSIMVSGDSKAYQEPVKANFEETCASTRPIPATTIAESASSNTLGTVTIEPQLTSANLS
jgi:hypothetical protein